MLQYGEDAAKEAGQPGGGGGGGGGGMSDLFDMLSGQGGRRAQRERRGDDVVHRLRVTLEELFNGSSRCVSCHLRHTARDETCPAARHPPLPPATGRHVSPLAGVRVRP